MDVCAMPPHGLGSRASQVFTHGDGGVIRWKHYTAKERQIVRDRRKAGVPFKIIAREINRPYRGLEMLAAAMGLVKRRRWVND